MGCYDYYTIVATSGSRDQSVKELQYAWHFCLKVAVSNDDMIVFEHDGNAAVETAVPRQSFYFNQIKKSLEFDIIYEY